MKFLICIALAAICLAKSGTEAADDTPMVSNFLKKLGVDTSSADRCEKDLMVNAEQLLQKSISTGSLCPYDANFVKCVGPVIRDVRFGVADLQSKAQKRCYNYYSSKILPQIFTWVKSVLKNDDATVVQMFLQIANIPAPVATAATTPVAPVAPVTPVAPVAPVAPVTPVAPVALDTTTPIVSKFLKQLGVDTSPADTCERGLMAEAEQLLQKAISTGSQCPFDANFVKCVGPVLRDVRSGVAALQAKAQKNCQYYHTANILPQIFNWINAVLANDDATVIQQVMKMMF